VFKKITIIGCGLIGSSIGLAIRERRHSAFFAATTCGYDTDDENLRVAALRNCIDLIEDDLKAAVEDANLIIVCTPLSAMPDIFKQIAPHLMTGAIVTDVGSVKRCVHEAAEAVMDVFVGSHPMAGSDNSGAAFADENLFAGGSVFVTKTAKTWKENYDAVCRFWGALGMKIVAVPVEFHDHVAARVSHLPKLLSNLLIEGTNRDEMKISGRSFRDATRLAKGDPKMWLDIILANKDHILKDLELLATHIQLYRSLIEQAPNRLLDLLEEHQNIRKRLDEKD
jgi:prephenate dehydrogenase